MITLTQIRELIVIGKFHSTKNVNSVTAVKTSNGTIYHKHQSLHWVHFSVDLSHNRPNSQFDCKILYLIAVVLQVTKSAA